MSQKYADELAEEEETALLWEQLVELLGVCLWCGRPFQSPPRRFKQGWKQRKRRHQARKSRAKVG